MKIETDHGIPNDKEIVGMIGAWRAINQVSNEALADLMGLSRSTFYKRLREPENMTLREYRNLCRLIAK
jgi:AraC-like DNA-binding protein